jgi:putative ABC transport system permease protein
MITDFISLAARNILHRKRRSLLTVVGIFIGIAAVVALVSLGQGLQNSVEAEFENIGSNTLFISPGSQFGGADTPRLTENDLVAVRSAREIDQAAGIVFSTTVAEHKDEQGLVTVLGTPTDETQELVENSWALTIEEGRRTRSTDTSNIVVGSTVANTVFGEEIGLRSQITVNGEEFRVVGILESTGDPGVDQAAILPLPVAREVVDKEDDEYDQIFGSVQNGFTPSEAKEEVEKELRNTRNVDEDEEDFTVSTQEDLLDSFNSILSVVRGVVIGIASISLLVGGVGIMNTMYTSVTQRTREIGVMKAIGAKNEQILAIFLFESGIIGLIGGIIGVIAGLGMSTAAALAATQATGIQITPYFGPELIGGALLFSFIVGMISGVFPARQAAKLQPADALRYE